MCDGTVFFDLIFQKMVIHQFFKQPGLTPIAQDEVFRKIVKAAAGREINNLETEVCYYVCSDTHGNDQMIYKYSKTDKLDSDYS